MGEGNPAGPIVVDEIAALEGQRLELALEAAELGTWELEAETGTVTASKRTCAMFGFETAQPRKEDWLAHLHPDDRDRVRGELQRAISGLSRYDTEYRVVGCDGSTRWVLAKGVLVGNNERGPRLVGVAQDITARKNAEQQTRALLKVVQDEKEKLSALIASINDEVWFVDAQKRLVLVNAPVLREFSLAGSDVRQVEEIAASYEVFRPDGSPRPAEEAPPLRALRGELVCNEEEIVRTPRSGELRHREVNAAPVRDASGKTIGSVSVVRDITEHKRSEADLAADLDALRRVHALSTSLPWTAGLEPLLHEITDCAVAIVGAGRGTLQLVEGNSLRIAAHHGHQQRFLDFLDSAEGVASPCGEAMKSGERVIVQDVESSPRFAGTPSLEVLREAGVRAIQSTPLRSRSGELLGILTTQWDRPHMPAEHDLWRVDLLARQAADLIEHNRAEAALRRLAQFPEENPNPVLRVAASGQCEYANAAAQLFLTQMGSGAGQPLPPGIEELIERAFREGHSVEAELGSERIFSFLAVRPPGETYVNLYGRDISESRKAEDQIRRSQRTFSELVERAPFGIYIVDSQLRIAHMNAGSQKGAFRNVRPVIGRDLAEAMRVLWPEPVAAEIVALFRHTLETGEPYYSPPFTHPRHDVDSVESYEWELHQVALPDGQHGVICYYFDSTKLRRAEAAVQESRRKYQALIETTNDFIWEMDAQGRYTYCSPQIEELWGIKPGEMTGRSPFDLMLAEEKNRTREAFLELVKRPRPFRGLECASYDGQGRVIHIDMNGVPFFGEDGKLLGFRGISRDITERKRIEASLRESEKRLFETNQRLEALMKALPVGVSFSDDPTCERATGNPAVLAQFEAGPGDNLSASAPDPAAPGREVHYIVEGREISADQLPLQRAVREDRVIPPIELEVRLPSGRRWFAEGSGAPIRDREGKVIGGVAVTVDITERKQAEERLRQSQKLESIGVLASGIAHDFNNLLTSIMGNASLLQEAAAPDGEQLRAIVEASEKAAALTRQLLAYAGKGQAEVTEFNVSRLVRSSADLMRVSIPKTVEVCMDVPRNLPAIRGDSAQIQQVVMNLVINAAEATENRKEGRVSVAARVRQIDAAAAEQLHVAAGPYLAIAVKDNGCGMDERTKTKIFDPFFTTKFTGRGLGLAAVQGILRSHKGAITVETAPGEGSTFTVYLPCKVQRGDTARRRHAAEDSGEPATVLIVDDEPYVCGFTKTALERSGHKVLVAGNGRQALELLSGEQVDLVLLDIVMPVLGGVDAFTEMRKKWPKLPVLIASGHSHQEACRLGVPASLPFIEKPYTLQALTAAVAKTLKRSRQPGN